MGPGLDALGALSDDPRGTESLQRGELRGGGSRS